MALASTEPAERDVLLRFVGVRSGAFEALGAATEEPVPSPERGERLRRLHDLLGDSVTLLALRTRALMASPGAPGEADHTYLAMLKNDMQVMIGALGGDASIFDPLVVTDTWQP